jgi:hypothetical protein
MAGIHFSVMEKVVLGGMFGTGWVLKLSHPSSLPSIPFGRLDKLISDSDQKSWSITVVNMEYARVSTTEGGGRGALLPSATYHVILGRTPAETAYYSRRLSEHLCGEEGFELKFEEKSVFNEAFANGFSILNGLHKGLSQFIAQKYATMP